jgi:hypothetical protein
MKTKIILCSLAIIFSGALMFSSSAMAVTPNPQCVQDAKNERNLCVVKCQEEFRADKDGCRNVDHDCADGCREDYVGCVDPYLTDLATCKAACQTTLDTTKANCRTNNPIVGSVERDVCIDGAQLAAFLCRDTCRENVAADLKSCSNTFRACIKACPPAPAP